jgi:predicted ribosome quality control (RQC) complex YloA/Tae2 family protein
MDIFLLKTLVDDLQPQLAGAVVNKVFQISDSDLLLRLWKHRDFRLLLSIHTAMPRLHLTTHRFRHPPSPPRFAAFLRAHLRHARLRTLVVQPYDRIVSLVWERPDDSLLTLHHELVGGRSNLVLVDTDGRILEVMKRVPATAAHPRALLPGQPYVAMPIPRHRVHLGALTREHLITLYQQGTLDVHHLQRLVLGLSPVLAAEILHRSQGDPHACWELLLHLRHSYEQQALSLSLCTLSEGTRYLSVLPLTHAAMTIVPVTEVQDAADALYQPLMLTTLMATRHHQAQKIVVQRQQKLAKKMVNLQRDYQRLETYLSGQRYGTLLLPQRVPRGATSVTVVDYYSPEPVTVSIALDPRLSVYDNAQVYFKKYRKAKNGLVKVRALLDRCTAEAQYLEGLIQRLAQAEDWPTQQELEAEIYGTRPPPQPRLAAPQPTPAPPYRTFTLRNGWTLYCGKNHQGNEVLLRQLAHPDDLWFHAHRQAGAHVLLKVTPHQEVSAEMLGAAASLAAFYSKGRDAVAVEVMYTQAKYVHKFRGARPGQIQVTRYQTLEVAPRLPAS